MKSKFDCDASDIERAVSSLNNIIITAANQSLNKCRLLKNKNKANNKNNKWYGVDLKTMKSNPKILGRLLCSRPYDRDIREKYYHALKYYKSQCKKEQRKFKTNIFNMMENLAISGRT